MNVGVDIGYGNVKVVVSNGSGSLEGKIFKSVVGADAEIGVVDAGFSCEVNAVHLEGTRYLIGDTALKHSSRFLTARDKDWVTTPSYRALLTHALVVATEGKDKSEPCHIVTGLPVKYFVSDKGKLENIVSDVASSLGLNAQVKTLYQPMGTFFNCVLDERGMVFSTDILNMRLGILDIGFYTADLITVDNRQVIENLSFSTESGISTALDAIAKDLEADEEYGNIRITPHDLDSAIRQGCKIKVFGEMKDFSAIASRRLRELAAELTAKARTVWHNGADLDCIFISGGGAEALAPYWSLYKHAKVVKHASLANASGYCKFAQRVSDRS